MRPGINIFNPYLIIPLLAAFFYSLYQIATRLNAEHDNNETMLFYNGLIGSIITLVFSYFFWQPLHAFSFIFFIFVLFGFLVYNEIPDIFTLFGAIIIVASGIFIFRYSKK